MRQPTLGTMMRIAYLYGKLDKKNSEIEKMTADEQIAYVADNGKLISQIVAYAVCSGRVTGKIFNSVVAWWLRWNVHPVFLIQAMVIYVENTRVRDFCEVIPLARGIAEILEPIGSH